ALAREKDKASKERLETLRRELADQREKRSALQAQWDSERAAIAGVRKLREELERARLEVEAAERAYDLNKAAELRHGRIPELEAQVRAAEESISGVAAGAGPCLLREEVTEQE